MATKVTISKCELTHTNLIVYFSAPMDVSEQSNPDLEDNYAVKRLGGDVKVTRAKYDAIQRATVLQLEESLPANEPYELTVTGLTFDGETLGALLFKSYQEKGTGKEEKKDKSDLTTLKKILQPSYAIGMKIITNDDYNNLKNEYFAQSELSLGLIIPLILIVLGLALAPQVGIRPKGLESPAGLMQWAAALAWFSMCAALVPISMTLFLVGTERYHKYRMELKLLILGNWKKQQEANKAANNGGSGNSSGTGAAKKSTPGTGSGALSIKVDPLTLNINSQASPSQSPPAPSKSLKDSKPGEAQTSVRQNSLSDYLNDPNSTALAKE